MPQLKTPSPLLSVLIPAYEYPDGIRRILRCFLGDCQSLVEILIFDDSFTDDVSNEVRKWEGDCKQIIYRRNRPSLGASRNWNTLLENAKGEYCLLMHHDDIPLGPAFVQRALDELKKDKWVDVLMMECVLMHDEAKGARRHVPSVIRSWIVRHTPAYLFRRNVIGPTSCLIVRRSIYPKFDENLRWLIDVEAYFRLRQITARWRICNNLQVASLLGRNDSITANLGPEVNEIEGTEQAYLIQKHCGTKLWLNTKVHRWVYVLETVIWALIRISIRFYGLILSIFGFSPAKKKDLKKALNQ